MLTISETVQLDCKRIMKAKFWPGKQEIGTDPFPSIPPSLLNSTDIQKYVHATGMLTPFNPKNLKGASYEACVGKEVQYWDAETEELVKLNLKEGDYFHLEPNSIAYVQINTDFNLPHYMALRFNLKIKNVYRGLLLGTGPLIDPGYRGRINIPLHNLTANRYSFEYGEGLIWIEFTKLSPHKSWLTETDRCSEEYDLKKIDPEKTDKNMSYFLGRAHQGPIISSIPKSIAENLAKSQELALQAQTKATDAETSAKNAEQTSVRIRNIGFVAGAFSSLTILIGIVAIVFQVIDLQKQVKRDLTQEIKKLEEQITVLKEGQVRLDLAGPNSAKKVLETESLEQKAVSVPAPVATE